MSAGPTIHAHGKGCTCEDCGGLRIPSTCLEEALQIIRGHAEGAVLDAGFDGGPAHAEMEDKELRELAARYEVDFDDLCSAVYFHEMTADESAGYGDSQERP